MLTQAVTELSATLAASPDIETSWNRIVQQGTPIIESVDTQTVRVTFLWRQPEETEVERVYPGCKFADRPSRRTTQRDAATRRQSGVVLHRRSLEHLA